MHDLLHALGELPLPPYITDGPPPAERGVYQTIYARVEGSSAAPTAGLHFTEASLPACRTRRAAYLRHPARRPGDIPARCRWRKWKSTRFTRSIISVSAETAALINDTRARGGRIVAVGTTSTRTLESAADEQGIVHAITGPTRLYIIPGYHFKVVDVQLTNFHMPRSTLLLLISAFAGREKILHAYREAVKRRYRFLSFGDAMLII